ncbi:TonB-dependent receptor [Sphingomonas sp. HMP6]|uniref:TonB-dependent receptor n=1 Tax=Sphingomonas sp. HMP6 TaxID=1517551 RepID=UPI001597480C|nr:TonB-dependent receptor [Sphingomonas sp. HMP6]BCA58552.1 TonB-dependent receptor [Sphingomonas sp. HMP6]
MLAGTAAGALLACYPLSAFAKDASTATPPGGDATSDIIIVTARQRAEDVQKIPIAVSVIDDEQIRRSYTVNTQQLSVLVPALNYSSANPRNTAFTIRGLGSSVVAVSQANDGLEPGVGFYVDQVYHARPATAAFDFADIERIEVLRGPQGTLFGKNTTAGAISITSKVPSFTPHMDAELSVGNADFVQARASATGALIGDSVAFRLSGLITRRDGVIHNTRTGADQNGIGNQAVRGQLLFKPTSDFQLRLTADFTNFQSACCTQVYLRAADVSPLRSATRQYGGPNGLAAQFGYAPPSTNPYDRLTDIDAALGVETNEGGVSAIAHWNLGGIGTLSSVSAWRFWNWDAANDRDYTGIPVQITQHIPSRQDQFSQELRLASNGEHRLGYVAGLYVFDQAISGRPISIYGPAGARYLIGTSAGTGAAAVAVPANLLDGYGTDGSTRLRQESYAGFGELTYKIVPRVTLSAGLRYTYEVKDGSYDTFTFGGPTVTSATLINAQLGVLRGQSYAARDRESNLSGRANLAWQATDTVLFYGSYARGFKSGGINLSGLPLDANNRPALATAVVRPELNQTYEGGIKARLLDKRLTVNLAGYYTDVRDFQATIVNSSQTIALRGYLSNIPKVTVKGFEADVTANLTRNFQLRGSVAYADGRYARYPAGPCPLEALTSGTQACNLTGRALAGLPKWATTIGGDYTMPVGSGAFILHADSNFRSSYAGESTLSRYTKIDGYNLTNASLNYRARNGLEIGVFARNLFDAHYIQNLTIQAGNSGLILGTPSDPRVIGVTLRMRQ